MPYRIVSALIIAVLTLLVMRACAGAQLSGPDFCQSYGIQKSSVAISVTSNGSGEHELVPAVAGQTIQVCALTFDLGGTTPTAEFDYGTKASAACDTGATALTGAMSAAKTLSGPLNYFTAPAGKELCINLTGTTPTSVGFVTYVQKSQ